MINETTPFEHITYIQSAEGTENANHYGEALEKRIYEWYRFTFRLGLSLIFITYVQTLIPLIFQFDTSSLYKVITNIILVILLMTWLMTGFTIHIRTTPRWFQRFWVRKLPKEGMEYYHHRMQIYD